MRLLLRTRTVSRWWSCPAVEPSVEPCRGVTSTRRQMAVARALTGRGLVAGQRVALVMANRVDLPIAYFGILRGGMVAVPMNPRSTADEIGRMLADAKVKLVLCDATGVTQVREALGEYRCDIVVDGADRRPVKPHSTTSSAKPPTSSRRRLATPRRWPPSSTRPGPAATRVA